MTYTGRGESWTDTPTFKKGHLARFGFGFVSGADKGADPRGSAAFTAPTALFHLFLPYFPSLISLSVFTLCCTFAPSFLFKVLIRFASIALNEFMYFRFSVVSNVWSKLKGL